VRHQKLLGAPDLGLLPSRCGDAAKIAVSLYRLLAKILFSLDPEYVENRPGSSFELVRQQLKDSYSETGRPSIDPEPLLRILLIGYLYGISSAATQAHCVRGLEGC
jgi:hypothetical protein